MNLVESVLLMAFGEMIQEPLTKELESVLLQSKRISLPKVQNLFLFAISHKTTPLVVREKFAIQESLLVEASKELKKYKSLGSFLLLSTCNRTEIYFTTSDERSALFDIFNFFRKWLSVENKIAKEYSVVLNGDEVINHAFNVASGLDSLVLGEKQVYSQVRTAYSTSQKEKTLDLVLELLFQSVIKCTKEVHKTTNLSKNGQSISSSAIDLANFICGPIKTKEIMVLGAGQMAKLALEHIVKLGGSKETVVLNRSPHRVIEFSDKYKVDRSFPFENVYKEMNNVDIIVAATGAPHFIIFAKEFEQVRENSNEPLYIFDISMPRNIDSEFAKLKNVKLYDIDSIQTLTSHLLALTSEDLDETKKIISKFKDKLYLDLLKTNLDTIIKDLKSKAENIRREKLSLLLNGKENLNKEEVDYLTKNLVNAILHLPLKNLKASSVLGSQEEKIQLLRDLFEI